MAKSGNQKGKLLYLAEIFHRETDEAHGLTLAELTERIHQGWLEGAEDIP